jgi:putative transposase
MRTFTGREVSPTAGTIGSQSVKSAEEGRARSIRTAISIDPHGYDAGKKIKGKKRHTLVVRKAC